MGNLQEMLQASWPILLMIIIFYFLLYRPQKKQQKERKTYWIVFNWGLKLLQLAVSTGKSSTFKVTV